MSDEEEQEVRYVKKQKVVHYGSLEEQERIRQAAGAKDSGKDAIKAGIAAGNIVIAEHGEFSIFQNRLEAAKAVFKDNFFCISKRDMTVFLCFLNMLWNHFTFCYFRDGYINFLKVISD